MGIMSEWEAFAFFCRILAWNAKEAIPLFEDTSRLTRQARLICRFILDFGNMGNNIVQSYRK